MNPEWGEAAEAAADDTAHSNITEQTLPQFIADQEAVYLCAVIEQAAGNMKEAARLAGISYESIRSKAKNHGLQVQKIVRVVRHA